MRNVVVTGGSRGLGLAISIKLAAAGYCAIAIARKESRELAAAIAASSRAGTNALQFLPFDLDDIDAMPRFVAALRKSVGPIHGLVNNAALGDDGALSLMHTAKIERLVRLNTLSPMVLTKYVVRAMMADGGGRIVNVASIVAFTGYSGLSVYGATGLDARIHALAGARGRAHGRQRQRGGARVSRHRHDAGSRRHPARADRAPQRVAKVAGGRRPR
jgi:3-oxoacyl-[acyl-carrier protein] reductase